MNKYFKNSFLIICIVLFYFSQSYSQQFFIQFQKNDSLFSGLNPNYWSTGILYIGSESLSMFNGNKDSVIEVNSGLFKKLLFELIHNSKFKDSSIVLTKISVDSVFVKAHRMLELNNSVPLGILNLKYNILNPYALDSGYVQIVNGILKENTNNYTKIYKESEIKIVAPLIDNIVTFDNNTIFFMLDSSFIFSNKNDTINVSLSYIEDSLSSRVIDFNNNSLFSISFNQNGISNILAKIKINGMFLQSFFLFKSYRTLISEQSFEITPDNYRTIGRVTIRYGCGNTSGKIRKPFVFVEGFDPGLNAGERDNYGRLNWGIFSNWNNLGDLDHDGIPDYQNLQKAKNLVNKLNADGFDIIYLEFKNSTKPLLDNAKVVVSLLNYINTYHQPKHKIILAGGSMGGLLTKIALNLMEQNNEIHRVRDWITFDSPHRGANIPLGDQMFVYFFSTGTKPQSEAIEAVNILKTPAAQQMLIYHYLDAFGSRNYPIFDLSSPFSLSPNYVRYKIAISNGSNKGINGNQGFGWGAQMVDMVTSCSGGLIKGRGVGKTWAIPENIYQQIFEGRKEECLFFSSIESMDSYVIGTLPIDNSPGGNRYTNQSLVYKGGNAPYPNHSFVPTISSLAIKSNWIINQSGKIDYFVDLKNKVFLNPNINYLPNPNIAYIKDHSVTDFDILYAPDNNQQHVEITDDNINFITNEIAPADLYLQNETYPLQNLTSDADQFEARNTITAGKNVTPKTAVGDFVVGPNANITFRAGNKIVLKDGFSAKAGSTFRAYIDPFDCPPAQRLSSSNPSDSKTLPENSEGALNTYSFTQYSSRAATATLFPNPTSSLVHFQLPTRIENTYILKITNLFGQSLSLPIQKLSDNMISIDFSNVAEGVYIIHYSDNQGNVFTNKVVVKR